VPFFFLLQFLFGLGFLARNVAKPSSLF